MGRFYSAQYSPHDWEYLKVQRLDAWKVTVLVKQILLNCILVTVLSMHKNQAMVSKHS